MEGRRKKGALPAGLSPSNVYTLLYPKKYQQGDEERVISELQLRRLDGGDMLAFEGASSRAERLFTLIERQTGLPRVVVTKLDWADLDRIDDVFGYFTEPGPATGAS